MKSEQLPLDLAWRAAHGRDDFLVAGPNKEAVAWIDRWPDWPSQFLLLTGPDGCGKTHLSHVWMERNKAALITADELAMLPMDTLSNFARAPLVIENIGPDVPEENLFHLYNLVKEKGGSVLMTSRYNYSEWTLTLPDLKSRLGTVQIARIEEPDDELFASVLVKLFADRQLQVTPDILQYLMVRLERSFGQARHVVSALDDLSLAHKRRITIPLVRDLLEKEGQL
ncbi:HdaA/DnaA family protein [Sneathiella sp.]|uniref:HdaA/DnaA family protein n=1 Tax=Sneathiella sp. TaxID=1964365 RepID=UPI0039E278F9